MTRLERLVDAVRQEAQARDVLAPGTYAQPAERLPGARGPRRKKGDRLPTMVQWANDPKSSWTKLRFDQFGLHARLAVKTRQALYYKAGRDRLLTIVLVRDLEGRPGFP